MNTQMLHGRFDLAATVPHDIMVLVFLLELQQAEEEVERWFQTDENERQAQDKHCAVCSVQWPASKHIQGQTCESISGYVSRLPHSLSRVLPRSSASPSVLRLRCLLCSPLRLLLSFGLPASPCLCHSFSLFLIFALPVCVLAKLSFAFRAAGALYCHCVSCVASQASASVRRTAHLKKKCSNECPLSELVRNRARRKSKRL